MKCLEQTWPLCVFWTHVGVHLLPTRVYCGWKSGESSPSVYLGAGTLVGMGCCFVGWKFWILCFTSLGCLRVAPGILDNESWRTRNRLYPSLESDLKRGRGLGSLSHCGQIGVLEACGGAVWGGGRPWELVQRCLWPLPVFAQPESLMLNAGGSPETCVYRLRSDGDRVAGRGQACAFGVRLSPM